MTGIEYHEMYITLSGSGQLSDIRQNTVLTGFQKLNLAHLRLISTMSATTVKEKRNLFTYCALTLLVGWQEGHPACKKWGMVEVGTG